MPSGSAVRPVQPSVPDASGDITRFRRSERRRTASLVFRRSQTLHFAAVSSKNAKNRVVRTPFAEHPPMIRAVWAYETIRLCIHSTSRTPVPGLASSELCIFSLLFNFSRFFKFRPGRHYELRIPNSAFLRLAQRAPRSARAVRAFLKVQTKNPSRSWRQALRRTGGGPLPVEQGLSVNSSTGCESLHPKCRGRVLPRT